MQHQCQYLTILMGGNFEVFTLQVAEWLACWTWAGVGDYVGDIYHHGKFYPDRFRGFVSAHVWFRAPRHKVTPLFLGGSWETLQPRRVHRFLHNIHQTPRFHRSKCLLGVAKPVSKVYMSIFLKNVILGTHSTGLRIFSPENGFSIGRLQSK